jgi:hypothetical protein
VLTVHEEARRRDRRAANGLHDFYPCPRQESNLRHTV